MTTDLANRNVGELAGPLDFTRERVELLKRTICAGATDDELELFVHACKRTGLDPFCRQIHAVKRWDGQAKREVMAIQTGIDGYRLIADRTERYMPGREPTFTYGEDGGLLSATAYVKKLAKDGTWHEVSATAHYSEYVGTTKDGSPNRMWREKPHIMLAKCAESQALRRAFPAEMSGVYTSEEMPVTDAAPARPAGFTPPEPTSHEPDLLDDDDEFRTALADAFRGQQFTMEQADAATAAVLKKHKVASITDLPLEKRHSFVAAIIKGDLYRFKMPPVEQPAAASA